MHKDLRVRIQDFISRGSIPKSTIPGSQHSCTFSFLRTAKLFSRLTVPLNIPTKNNTSDPVALHPCQPLVLSLFSLLAIRVSVHRYIIVGGGGCLCVFTCVCVYDIKYLFLCLFVICIFLFSEMSVYIFCPFSDWIVSFECSLYMLGNSPL